MFSILQDKLKNIQLFLSITLSYFIIIFLSSTFLSTDDLIVEHYSDLLSNDQLSQYLENKKEWWWISYSIIPIIILIRTSVVSFCLSVGLFLYDIENKIQFKQFFRIALIGEFVLVFVGVFKLIYFYFFKTEVTLQELQQFYPLSYINFLDVENLEPWLVYPLQTVNLFEIMYFFVLVYGMHKLLKNNYWKSFEITAASYGTGLLIWLGLVMFLTLNIS